ncbi:hypothetical protein CMI37_35005 [Candidatus Pacearchaeota archaeon]|nr:hypothetical protein [Candidatus Pacearchaeota archaeon]
MNVSSTNVVKWIEHLIADTHYMMEQTGYMPTEKDYSFNINGKKEYAKEWLDNMPPAYSTLVGKHDALVDLKRKFIEAQDLPENEINERNIFFTNPRNN